MTAVIFSGPSLPPDEARRLLPDAEFPGPAGKGDIYDACRPGVTEIGLIDGYFEHRMSPWHKEILWALDRGVMVFGAASLGALRAAELASYGMKGVGVIFERFASGDLEDDDEVAVVHETAERNYALRSDALVNIRATIEAAAKSGALAPDAGAALVAIGRAMFYPRRTLAAVIAAGRRLGIEWRVPEPAVAIDQKRADAHRMIEVMRRQHAAGERTRPAFSFSYTELWHEFRRERAASPSSAAVQARSDALRRSLGLFTESDTRAWLRSQGLTLESFTRLVRAELAAEP